MLTVLGQLVSLYGDTDLATPIGRFRAMSEGLGHFAPILIASLLLVWGTWNTDSKDKRGIIAGVMILMVLFCLIALPFQVPDAQQLSSGVIPVEVRRFRFQLVRAIIYLTGTIALLGVVIWKYVRRVPIDSEQ